MKDKKQGATSTLKERANLNKRSCNMIVKFYVL